MPHLPENTYAKIDQLDQFWHQYRTNPASIAEVVTEKEESLGTVDTDVVICGGTLGILIGCFLQYKGFQVAIVEKGLLQGRIQEWNISRQELAKLVTLELLTSEELEDTIVTEYNPGRVGFHQGTELWVKDILNIGVSPRRLLEILKQKFIARGGKLLEKHTFHKATVYLDGVKIYLDGGISLTTQLLLDAMGHFSPIARQARNILFGSVKPDGICMVVGGCATGIPNNDRGDLLYTFTPIIQQCQYFWEAFPACDGRTTYLFTYVDTHPDRPTFRHLFTEYLRLLPQYQGVDLAEIEFLRVLQGFFPAYRSSPLPAAWRRVLSIGDSSGNQSPLSFGGFGAMIRHLGRLGNGLTEAIGADHLSQQELSLLQPYQPNISVTWLFQQVMRVPLDQTVEPNFVNQLLSSVFQGMSQKEEFVLHTFLQDVIQFPALSQAMIGMLWENPLLVLQVISQVGIPNLVDWLRHYTSLGIYHTLQTQQPWSKTFTDRRKWEAWSFGAGQDRYLC